MADVAGGVQKAVGVAAEVVGHLAGMKAVKPQQLQRGAGAAQRALKHFALHMVGLGIGQLHRMQGIAGPCHHGQAGVDAVQGMHQPVDLGGIVHRHHHGTGLGHTGGVQQVGLGGIAKIHLETEAAGHVHGVGIVVDDGGLDACGQQHAGHGLAVAAKTGQQHGGGFFGQGIGGAVG